MHPTQVYVPMPMAYRVYTDTICGPHMKALNGYMGSLSVEERR